MTTRQRGIFWIMWGLCLVTPAEGMGQTAALPVECCVPVCLPPHCVPVCPPPCRAVCVPVCPPVRCVPLKCVPARTPKPAPVASKPVVSEPPPAPVPPTVKPVVAQASPTQDPPAPVLVLRLRVPAVVPVGQEIHYRICVENVARADAHHVLVRNPLPANARFVRADPEPLAHEPEILWNLGTVKACECKEITLVLRPTDGEEVTNCARVQFEYGQCVVTKIAKPELTFRKCGPEQAQLYDMLKYQLEIRNTGAVPIHNIHVKDNLPEGLEHESAKPQLTWTVDSLEAGQMRCIEYQVVAQKTGVFRNQAELTTGELRLEADSTVTVTEAQLALKKTGPATCMANQCANYLLTVSNPGTAAATNVILTDHLPAGMVLERASDNGQLQGTQVRWNLGTLPPGTERSVELQTRADVAGRYCNQASVTADRGLTARDEVCTDFRGVAALLLQIDQENPIEVGSEGWYRIRITNTGTETAHHVRVEAELAEQVQFLTAHGPALFQTLERTIRFDPIHLAVNDQQIYEVRIRGVKPGEVLFRVSLTSDHLPSGPVRSEQRTTIYEGAPPARLQQPQDGQLPPAPPKLAPPMGTTSRDQHPGDIQPVSSQTADLVPGDTTEEPGTTAIPPPPPPAPIDEILPPTTLPSDVTDQADPPSTPEWDVPMTFPKMDFNPESSTPEQRME
ncbi:MAG: hypothetical protein ACK4RK_14815 [Gemmataceae bacterium]